MKLVPAYVAAFVLAGSAVAAAPTHEPVSGALSGRSPHTLMRPIAQPKAACGNAHVSAPSGKLMAHRPATACPAEAQNAVARTEATGERAGE